MVELTVLRFQGMIPPFHGSGGNVMVGDRNMYVRGKKTPPNSKADNLEIGCRFL